MEDVVKKFSKLRTREKWKNSIYSFTYRKKRQFSGLLASNTALLADSQREAF